MREIRFRGKKIGTGEWVYGSLHIGDKCWITQKSQDETKGLQPFRLVAVIPGTVGQYTGLKDKRGKEIYEADVLSRKEWGFGGYHDDEERYVVKPLDDYLDSGEEEYHFKVHLWSEYCEVIGNIHEEELTECATEAK